MWTKYWLVICWYKLWYMVYSINNAWCVHTFFCPSHSSQSILLPFPALDTYHICESLLLNSYSFSVSLVTYLFLSCDMQPPLPADASSLSPRPVFAVYHYHVSAMYVHCHHHFLLTFFSSCFDWCPSVVSLWSFCHHSSHCLLLFSFFMYLCAWFFLVCAVFFCCIFILVSRANNSHLSAAPIWNLFL